MSLPPARHAARSIAQGFNKHIPKAPSLPSKGCPGPSTLTSTAKTPSVPQDSASSSSVADSTLAQADAQADALAEVVLRVMLPLAKHGLTCLGLLLKHHHATHCARPKTAMFKTQSTRDHPKFRERPTIKQASTKEFQLIGEPITKDFRPVGGAYTETETDKVKIPRWKTIDPATSLDRLKDTKWEGKFTSSTVDLNTGTCFYGDPIKSEYGDFYALTVTRGGVVIEREPSRSTTAIGTYSQVTGESTTESILKTTGYKVSENFDSKPGQLNLLNTRYSLFLELGDEYFVVVNEAFLDKVVERRESVAVLTPITDQVAFRKPKHAEGTGRLEITGFGKEILFFTRHSYVYHPASGRMINGDKITGQLQKGAILVKVPLLSDQTYFYHAKSNTYYRQEEAEGLVKKGEKLVRPDIVYWKLVMPEVQSKSLVPFEDRQKALTVTDTIADKPGDTLAGGQAGVDDQG